MIPRGGGFFLQPFLGICSDDLLPSLLRSRERTNQQLWLSIGIPSVLIVLAWLQTNARLSDVKDEVFRRFTSFEKSFDNIEARFDRSDLKFEKIEARLDRIDGDLRKFYGNDQKLEGRIEELSARLK